MPNEALNARIDDVVDSLKYLQKSVDDLQVTTTENSVVLKQNTKDVAEHIQRTNLLQAQVTELFIPIKFLKFLLVVAGGLAGASGAALGLVNLIKVLRDLF